MADRYWVNDDVDGLWDNANNWSATSGGTGGSGVPTSSDDVYFEVASSIANCSINTTLTAVCASVSMNTSYTGIVTQNQDLDVSGAWSMDAGWDCNNYDLLIGGNADWGINISLFDGGSGTITITGNCIVATGADNINFETSTVDLIGSANLSNHSSGNDFYLLKISAITKTTTLTADVRSRMFDIGAGTLAGGFDLNSSVGLDGQKIITVHADATINIVRFFLSVGNTRTLYMDGFTSTTTFIKVSMTGTSSVLMLTTRDLTLSSYIEVWGNGDPDGVFDFNDFDVTVSNLNLTGFNNSISSVKCGSGIITINSDLNVNNAASVSSAPTLDLESCTMHILGDFLVYENGNIVPGTSTVYMEGSTQTDLNLFGENLYSLKIDKTSNTCIALSHITCNSQLTIVNGTFDLNGFDLVMSTFLLLAGTFLSKNGEITLAGTFFIASGGAIWTSTGNIMSCAGISIAVGSICSPSSSVITNSGNLSLSAGITWNTGTEEIIQTSTATIKINGILNKLSLDGVLEVYSFIINDVIINHLNILDNGIVIKTDIIDLTISIKESFTSNNQFTVWGGGSKQLTLRLLDNFTELLAYDYGDINIEVAVDNTIVGSSGAYNDGTIETTGDLTVAADTSSAQATLQMNNLGTWNKLVANDIIIGNFTLARYGKINIISSPNGSIVANGDFIIDASSSELVSNNPIYVRGDVVWQPGIYTNSAYNGHIVIDGTIAQDINFGSNTPYQVRVSNTTAKVTFSFAFSDQGLAGAYLSVDVNVNVAFTAAGTFHFKAWKLEGASGLRVLESNIGGSQAGIIVDDNNVSVNTSFKDINLTGSITDATSPSNVNAGNNNEYPPGPDGIQFIVEVFSGHTIGIGVRNGIGVGIG